MKFKLICGPPGAGKNSFVNRCFQKGDILIDIDRLYDAITLSGVHAEKSSDLLDAVLRMKSVLLKELLLSKAPGTVWVIACIPGGRRREITARQLKDADVYLIMPDKKEVLRRIRNDGTRTYSEEYIIAAVDDWYRRYSSSGKDKIIKE